jgi:acyl dehydratase
MPEAGRDRVRIAGKDIQEGQVFDIGVLRSSTEDIIAFARYVDPLPLHIDPTAAEAGLFGGIVASGAQLYIEFHKSWFVSAVGGSVLCGLGITDWNFHQPHFPDQDYRGTLTVQSLQVRPEKGTAKLCWKYRFFDAQDTLVQTLEVNVLHRLDP